MRRDEERERMENRMDGKGGKGGMDERGKGGRGGKGGPRMDRRSTLHDYLRRSDRYKAGVIACIVVLAVLGIPIIVWAACTKCWGICAHVEYNQV